MSTISEALEQRRQTIITQATTLAQMGVAESRNLSGEEQQQFDTLIAEAEQLAQRAQSIREGEERAHELHRSFERTTGHSARYGMQEGTFGKWAREARNGDSFDLSAVPGAERRAVAAYRSGKIEERAMSAAGGVGADGVYGTLWEYAVAGSQILQAGATIIQTSDGNTLPLPAVTAHATGATAAANAPITASDPVLTTVNLDVTKHGYLTLVPNELLQDVTFDLEGYLARAAGRELGKIIGAKASAAMVAGFATSGATAPTGSIGAVTGAVFADAIFDLFHSVLPEYRSTPAFVMSDPTAAVVRKTKDAAGHYVWERNPVPGNPGVIDGAPVYIDSNLPSPTGTAKIIYFGDFSALAVRIAGGIRFERSSDYAFGNDQTAFRAIVRTGSVVVDPNAVKFLQLTAS